jgi:hypothetical protein
MKGPGLKPLFLRRIFRGAGAPRSHRKTAEPGRVGLFLFRCRFVVVVEHLAEVRLGLWVLIHC